MSRNKEGLIGVCEHADSNVLLMACALFDMYRHACRPGKARTSTCTSDALSWRAVTSLTVLPGGRHAQDSTGRDLARGLTNHCVCISVGAVTRDWEVRLGEISLMSARQVVPLFVITTCISTVN